jgi:hypothetical protein
MTKRRILLFSTVIMCLLYAACKQERDPCLQPVTVAAKLGTYKATETDTGIVTGDSLLPAATIAVLDSPMAFAYGAQGISKFTNIILSPYTDSTRIFIQPDSARKSSLDRDTVTFYYNRQLHFISNACGYTHYFSIYDVKSTNYNIDSVKLMNGSVSNDANIENVKIYY